MPHDNGLEHPSSEGGAEPHGQHSPHCSQTIDAGSDVPVFSPDSAEPSLAVQAAETFARALADLRSERGLSQHELAHQMGYDKSYISHIEACRQPPTQPFALQADRILGSGQVLTRLWHNYYATHSATTRQKASPARPLVAEHMSIPVEPGNATSHATPAAAEDGADAAKLCTQKRPLLVEPASAHSVMDLRGATGVQIGDGNTQHLTF